MPSEGYSSWFVCLSVCRRLFWHYWLQGGLLVISAASELRKPEKQKGDFPEMTTLEICLENKRKSQYASSCWLTPRPDPLALCRLEAQEMQRRPCVDSQMLSMYYCS